MNPHALSRRKIRSLITDLREDIEELSITSGLTRKVIGHNQYRIKARETMISNLEQILHTKNQTDEAHQHHNQG